MKSIWKNRSESQSNMNEKTMKKRIWHESKSEKKHNEQERFETSFIWRIISHRSTSRFDEIWTCLKEFQRQVAAKFIIRNSKDSTTRHRIIKSSRKRCKIEWLWWIVQSEQRSDNSTKFYDWSRQVNSLNECEAFKCNRKIKIYNLKDSSSTQFWNWTNVLIVCCRSLRNVF